MKRKYALAALFACVACSMEDIDDPDGLDEVEFRVDEAQCLQPTAPTASDTLAGTLAPGEIIAYAGHYFVVPGAPANLDYAIAHPHAVKSFEIGDVVRVVNGGSSARFKVVAVANNNVLDLMNASSVLVHWTHIQTLDECLDDVFRELTDCIDITHDQGCCEQGAEVYEALCADDPTYFVPWNTGDILADLCEIDLPGDPWVFGTRDISVGSMDCEFTGWVDGAGASAAVDISNGFLTACVASGDTPVGCAPF